MPQVLTAGQLHFSFRLVNLELEFNQLINVIESENLEDVLGDD